MDILFSDEHIIVINKPAGLAVQPDGWEPDAPYLVKLLEDKYEKIWVVHRLDKFTSGVMAFALTAEAHRSLNIQFEKHEIEKVYRAITVGNPPWQDKITKFPLRANVGHKHRTMVDNKHGIRAETQLKVLNRNEDNALIEARPMTGRTHQIRVHAYALGYPLLGDILYSAPETDLIARPALHAYTLKFTHPESGGTGILYLPLPRRFFECIETIESVIWVRPKSNISVNNNYPEGSGTFGIMRFTN